MAHDRPTADGAKPAGIRPATPGERRDSEPDATVCPRCGESLSLAKVKGCVQCLSCHFKFDCNGW